jgi:hypothetical protein
MVLDANILQEKLIEAWKLRSDETSFSASLSPLIAQCQSEEEFRTLFTSKIKRISFHFHKFNSNSRTNSFTYRFSNFIQSSSILF